MRVRARRPATFRQPAALVSRLQARYGHSGPGPSDINVDIDANAVTGGRFRLGLFAELLRKLACLRDGL